MVHFNISHKMEYKEPEVHNPPCQHAFILVGTEQVFGVHMTQYHCEKHKYQLIMHIDLPKAALKEYRRQREMFPEDTFILCNRIEDKFSIPSLGGGIRTSFTGAIYRGFREPTSAPPPDWFPWNDEETLSVADLGPIDVTVKRIVLFRPFTHNESPPEFANYYLFGAPGNKPGDPGEAHMTNLQTASLLTGPFEPPFFGLDVDHVMSLQDRPSWISDEMLVAGVTVSIPAIPRYDEDGEQMVFDKPPFEPGDPVQLMYRGLQPPRAVVAGNTFLWASAVCNSEALVHGTPDESMIISAMPYIYWV